MLSFSICSNISTGFGGVYGVTEVPPVQSAFPFYLDGPARPAKPERLMFLLFPDKETALRVWWFAGQFIRKSGLQGRRIKWKRLHISLQHVGDYSCLRTKFIYAAKQAGNAVATCPFEVTFRSVGSFEGAPAVAGRPRKRPLVLLAEGDALLNLHGVLGAAMERNGLKASADFTPHMTLLYGRRKVPFQPIKPIRFTATAFALVHSELGLSKYNLINRWSFQG
ncbi:2'-5' RNA ligase family protein [Chelativorans sp. M5D2P16]|uniref:2'-5' RNA ligase family protein n=1 Tax=Chelativorans sp. M5D2P16 TaxID=3095678 RepID=UPI002ACA87FD|nr:2'-5' RNA ligase family protein [Chelativorans sp. M5D2P16]MDZ5699861.1 2'-5' RNA ligase family protein [Chelativorans sp. M5D2P16]